MFAVNAVDLYTFVDYYLGRVVFCLSIIFGKLTLVILKKSEYRPHIEKAVLQHEVVVKMLSYHFFLQYQSWNIKSKNTELIKNCNWNKE